MKTLLKVVSAIAVVTGLVLAGGYVRFKTKVDHEVRNLLTSAEKDQGEVVTAEMLQGLPEPVQRYLTYSGVVGKPMVKTVRLTQRGRMRASPEQPWMEVTAEEYYSVSPPAFIWRAVSKPAGLPLIRIRDRYGDGTGHMWVTLDGLYTIVDGKGPDMDHASLMRYLNEMTWFPSAFLGKNVSWQAVDDHSAQVTLTDNGLSATAMMFFDDEGRVTNFTAKRYRAGYGIETWSTPFTEYGEFHGLRLPRAGQAVWNLSSGDLAYGELEITDIEYNQAGPENYARR